MHWNRFVQAVARLTPRRGFLCPLLTGRSEVHSHLFGKYRFEMDLSLGFMQKVYYLKPNNYESEMQEALRTYVRPGMIALDIGANTGYVTLLLADLVGETGKVFSFEPYAPNFKLLERNVRANGLSQVEVFCLALSDVTGSARLYLSTWNDGGHSFGDLIDETSVPGASSQVLVKTTTLDEFLEEREIPRIDVLKIDVEGAETLVFAGARRLLSRTDAPAILCEVYSVNQARFQKSEKDLRAMLYEFGYRSYFIRKGLTEFGLETSIRGLANILFLKAG
jgi:FkbM family methyltransferase